MYTGRINTQVDFKRVVDTHVESAEGEVLPEKQTLWSHVSFMFITHKKKKKKKKNPLVER